MAANLDGLDPTFAAKIQQLVALSGGKVKIVSGYRSVEQQSALGNSALSRYGSAKEARKWVAPPGKSNHNQGKAVDLGGDLKLAAKLAPGLGLHFPMPHEPWHVEPIGHRGSKQAYTTGSVRAAERREADAVAPAAVAAAPTTQDPFTFEYQLQSLGNLLLAGAKTDG